MAGGSLGDNIGLKEDAIKRVCGLACKANNHKSTDKLYFYDKVQISSETYHVFSFPGSWDPAEWFVNKPFGVSKINSTQFPSLRSIGNDELAWVNEGFAKRFDRLLETNFEDVVCN